MKSVIIIPVRYGSQRFPGKPLISIGGKPLIRQVWEQALGSRLAKRVIVATDDERIRDAIASCGGEAVMTVGEFRTGTDRLAWVAERIPADAYVNLQGDELIRDALILDDLIAHFEEAQPVGMGTLKRLITEAAEEKDPNVIKVVTDQEGYALYFSRATIPFDRDREAPPRSNKVSFYKHLGIYIYRKDTLLKFSRLPAGILEKREKLEQLRALENGIRIKVWETSHETIRIDTPDDTKQAESLWMKAGSRRPI